MRALKMLLLNSWTGPNYGGMYYSCLKKIVNSGPVTEEHEGTSILHKEHFATESGKAKFVPLSYRQPAELLDEQYPWYSLMSHFYYHTIQ